MWGRRSKVVFSCFCFHNFVCFSLQLFFNQVHLIGRMIWLVSSQFSFTLTSFSLFTSHSTPLSVRPLSLPRHLNATLTVLLSIVWFVFLRNPPSPSIFSCRRCRPPPPSQLSVVRVRERRKKERGRERNSLLQIHNIRCFIFRLSFGCNHTT